jgi:hypothetical protein
MTKPKIVFAVLVLISAVAVAFAFYYRVMAGVFMHDSNFQTFQDTLSDEQRRGILWSLRGVATGYTWLLVITNALWLGGACYFLSRLRRRQD